MDDRTGTEEEGKGGIKVVDRRLFTAEGERRDEREADSEKSEEPAAERATSQEPPGAEAGPPQEGPGFEHRSVDEPEGVDFTMLLNAMAQPALLFLGEIPHPGTNEPTIDLVQARLQIDMLELLRVKCRGNLTPQEEGLMDRVLYQLRMLYVSRSGSPGPQE